MSSKIRIARFLLRLGNDADTMPEEDDENSGDASLTSAHRPLEVVLTPEMSKLYCSETAEFCAREGQQIFGGYGLMKEYDIERHYRDAALLRIGEGTSEIQRIVISRLLGC